MFKSRRQHPVAAITKVLEIIRGNFITLLLILFVSGSGDEQSLINLTWVFGTIIVLLVWGIVSWLRFTYRVEEDQLVIEQGVLMQKKLYITKDRIQVIDITSGIVQRMFGLVEVQVKTAGSSSREAKISAVTREEANVLREILRKESTSSRQEAVEGDTGADSESSGAKRDEVYRLDGKDLLIAASTSGSLGVALSIVGTAFSQIDQLFTEQQIIRYLESVIPSSASYSLIISSVIVILVVSWVLSFLGTAVKYAGFAIRLKDEELIISHGFFERKQLTIPYNRIQAIQIKDELLRQPFGFVTLKIDSAGYGDQGGRSVMLMPILKKTKLAGFLEKVLPEYSEKAAAVHPPPRSARRYVLRMGLFSLVAVIPLSLSFDFGFYPFLLVLPALLLGYFQYRDAAVGAGGNTMILRYRQLSRKTVVIKKYRIQTVEWSSNPFQQRAGLAHFSATVASGSEGHEFTVRYLNHDHAVRFWDWPSRQVKETGEATGITDGDQLLPEL